MNVFTAVQTIENDAGNDVDEEEALQAWQTLVDTGVAWRLQGWYGRQAEALIEAGLINEGRHT